MIISYYSLDCIYLCFVMNDDMNADSIGVY